MGAVRFSTLPSGAEARAAANAARALAIARGRGSIKWLVLRPDGRAAATPIALPASVVSLLHHVLTQLAEGHGVTVVPVQTEITTQQAADVLNVSRPYLVQLLERGEIPHRRVGTRRRVLLADLLAYKRREDARAGRTVTEVLEPADGFELQ